MRAAVILAAGEGRRLAGLATGPKGLVEIGGEALVPRSIRLLRAAGIERITLVTGAFADAWSGVDAGRAHNPRWPEGALSSLRVALDAVREPFLLLESDLLYEPRALTAVLDDSAPAAVLCSGETGATDEVWVEAREGRLVAMSKDRAALGSVCGEFVGITKVSTPLAAALREARGTSYDEDGLVQAARAVRVGVVTVPDLVWGELDDATHLHRLRTVVAPGLR